jgi:CheY-like chemotaxis protein
MGSVIKWCGHEVQFAINGHAAIEAAKRFHPDVVVLDLNLPDVAGDNVARQLRSEPGLENVRVIAVSSDDRMKVRALQAGCAEFHVKPVSLQLLEQLLRR